MRSETKKTPPTKPATPISKRGNSLKPSAHPEAAGQGVAAVEQWDAQRAKSIEELPDEDVKLDEGADPTSQKDAPTADP